MLLRFNNYVCDFLLVPFLYFLVASILNESAIFVLPKACNLFHAGVSKKIQNTSVIQIFLIKCEQVRTKNISVEAYLFTNVRKV